MKLLKILPIFIVILLFGIFGACSSQISGILQEGGSADLMVDTRLENRMTALIQTFQLMMGPAEGDSPILDGQAISRSMAAAPGMGKVSLANNGPASLEGKVEVTKIGDFLSIAGREKRFVNFSETPDGGSITISLDREIAPDVITLLSADAISYLTALMAPAATGEALSQQEYLLLVNSLYGPAIVEEIKMSRIWASIGFPGPISSIQGGKASGSRAQFQVPLLDILVLDKPLFWEISWEK